MRFKSVIVWVTLSTMLFAYGPGMGQGLGKGNMSSKCLQIFKDFDKNGDGFMQRPEFTKMRASNRLEALKRGGKLRHANDAPSFSDIDTNGDKKLSESEFQVYLRYR
jgi:hypothetical protein